MQNTLNLLGQQQPLPVDPLDPFAMMHHLAVTPPEQMHPYLQNMVAGLDVGRANLAGPEEAAAYYQATGEHLPGWEPAVRQASQQTVPERAGKTLTAEQVRDLTRRHMEQIAAEREAAAAQERHVGSYVRRGVYGD